MHDDKVPRPLPVSLTYGFLLNMIISQFLWRYLSRPSQLSWVLVLGLVGTSLVLPQTPTQAQTTTRSSIKLTTSPEPTSTTLSSPSSQGAEGLSNFNPSVTALTIQPYQVDGTQIDVLDLDGDGDRTDLAPPPPNVIGDGTLFDVAQTAADVWEAAFGDIFEGNDPALGDLDLGIGWANFSLIGELVSFPGSADPILLANLEADGTISLDIDGLIAYYLPADQFPENFDAFNLNQDLAVNGFPEDGLILFNSRLPKIIRITDLATGAQEERPLYLFLDDNPLDSTFSEVSNGDSVDTLPADLNTGRLADLDLAELVDSEGLKIPDNALVVDLFTVALHEIQHALGLTEVNSLLRRVTDDGLLVTEVGGVPTTYQEELSGAHLADDFNISFTGDERVVNFRDRLETINPTVSGEYVAFNRRKCLSAVDIYATAAASGLEVKDLNPCQTLVDGPDDPDPVDVPEPGALVGLLAMAGMAIAGRKSLKS